MANRATDADVRAIRPSTVITDYTPYINASNSVVNDMAASCGSSFSEAKLKEIEIWLSAHYAGATDPTLTKEKFESAENTFQRGSDSGVGIMSTNYGQTANMLSNGCLVQLDMQAAAVSFA